MKYITIAMIMLLLFTALAGFPAAAETVIQVNSELPARTREEALALYAEAMEAYLQNPEIAAELEAEITTMEFKDPFSEDEDATMTEYTLTHQGNTMRFLMNCVGYPNENGRYPLFITLHGGGEGDPGFNDGQWLQMYEYYQGAVKNGIYVACRGITDTWDLHFRPESYPLYDRLIQVMIRLYQADPNQVYLLGFSAGGDGVYQIAPKMADRFAAVNMSSGHPNGVSLRNLSNCPISIQVGVRDYYSQSALRCVRAAEFERVLANYREEYGFGYDHQVLVHVPAGHNFNDQFGADDVWEEQEKDAALEEVLTDPAAYADPSVVPAMYERFMDAFDELIGSDDDSLSYYPANENPSFDQAIEDIVHNEFHLDTVRKDASAVRFVTGFIRNPLPKTIVWDLSTRAPLREITSFYWLRADHSVNQGVIAAALTGDNTITVTPDETVNGDFSILVHPAMLDVSRPIHLLTPNGEFQVMVHPSEDMLRASMRETGDPELAWVAEIPYSLFTDN